MLLTAKSVVRYAAFIVLTAFKTNSNTKNPRPAKRARIFVVDVLNVIVGRLLIVTCLIILPLKAQQKLQEQIFSVINRTLEKHNKVDRIVCDLTYSFHFSIV